MAGFYEIMLRSKDGLERRVLAYLPTEETKKNFLASAKRRGLEATIINP